MTNDNNSKLWRSRFSIKRGFLVFLAIAVFILSGFLLFWAIQFAISSNPCATPGCLLATAQILTYIDPSIDPCEDFFKFACGKYIQNTNWDSKAAPVKKLQMQVLSQVDEIIKEPIKDDDHYLIKSQKELIRTCMNETAVGEETLDKFKELLEELHGWPVAVGHQWNQNLFDWKDAIYKLRQRGYYYSMMLTIGPVINPRNTSQYVIRIEQPFIYIRDKKEEHYKNYMTEVAVMFGAERHFAEIEMEKVLDFKERLKKIGKKNKGIPDNPNDSEFNQTAELLSTTFPVEEFQKDNNEIDWLDFINNILYPSANISREDYVIFPKPEFLEAFFKLSYKTPKRVQANYIIWTALENIIRFMSAELKQIKANYTFQTLGSSCPKDRFEFCQNEINTIIFPRPADILYVRKYLPKEKRENIRELLRSIRAEFISLLKKTLWMDDESKQKAVEKAQSIGEIIGAVGDYFDDTTFDEFEFIKKDDFQNDSFINMYLSRMRDQTDAKYSVIYKSANDDFLFLYNMLTTVNALYEPGENLILLTAGILQGIFYNDDRPMYLNYGAIGTVMGHEFTHGFCKIANERDQNINESMWTEETTKGYEEKTKCIIQNAEDFDVENIDSKINGTKTLEENIADYTGVKVSYAAYKNWVQDKGEEPQLVGIDYSPYQLFWISAVALHCYHLKTEEKEILIEVDNHALNVFRATGPLRNNQDFAKDFNCPVGSKMNPLEKCQVF